MLKVVASITLKEGIDYKNILGDSKEKWAIISRGLDVVNPIIGSYDTYADAERVWKSFETGLFPIAGSIRDFYYLKLNCEPSQIAHWHEAPMEEVEL